MIYFSGDVPRRDSSSRLKFEASEIYHIYNYETSGGFYDLCRRHAALHDEPKRNPPWTISAFFTAVIFFLLIEALPSSTLNASSPESSASVVSACMSVRVRVCSYTACALHCICQPSRDRGNAKT